MLQEVSSCILTWFISLSLALCYLSALTRMSFSVIYNFIVKWSLVIFHMHRWIQRDFTQYIISSVHNAVITSGS